MRETTGSSSETNAKSATGPLRLALVFGGLYAAQGIGASMAQFVTPTILRDAGLSLALVGLTYFLFAPIVLKPLWAPALDSYVSGDIRRRRISIAAAQLALALGFAVAASTSPNEASAPWLLALLAIVMTVIATQDISTDALVVEATPPGRRGVANGAQVAGTYAGYVLCVGAWMPLYGVFGWRVAMLALAAVLAAIGTIGWIGSAPFSRAVPLPEREATSHLGALLAPFRRPLFRNGLAFLALYQIGARTGLGLLGPFLTDSGLSLVTIGWITGFGMAIAGVLGGVFGPALLRAWGATRMLAICGLLHALTFAGLFAMASAPTRPLAIVAPIVLMESIFFALAYVALFTRMMEWCAPERAGSDFALLQSADSSIAIAAGALGGSLAALAGYAPVFLAASMLLALTSLSVARGVRLAPARPRAPSTDLSHLGAKEQ